MSVDSMLWRACFSTLSAYLTHTPNRSTNQERALHCFERVAVAGKEDVGQSYGMAAALTPYSCREEVIDLLVKVRGPC